MDPKFGWIIISFARGANGGRASSKIIIIKKQQRNGHKLEKREIIVLRVDMAFASVLLRFGSNQNSTIQFARTGY